MLVEQIPDAARRAIAEVDMSATVRWIARHRLALTIAAVLAGVAAFAVAGLSPTVYRAAATLAISPPGANPAPLHVRIENRAVAEEVTRRFALDQRNPPVSADRLMANHVRVEDVWGRDLLRIHVTMPDRRVAADIANALAESAVHAAPTGDAEQDVLATDALKRQRDYALERLRQSEMTLRNSAGSSGIETDDAVGLLIGIEAEQAAIARAELELRKLPANGAWTRRQELLNEEIVRRRARLTALHREREMTARGAPHDQNDGLLSQASGLSPQIDYDVARDVYIRAAIRYEEAVVKQLADRPQLDIVERASIPEAPVSRRHGTSTALGMIAGLVLCAAALAVRDILRPRTREAS
jgi:uncharacterized protein involved in exopolysaccharide biosynthesis